MVDVSIGNETSPEANWNRQADRQADGQTCVLGGCASKNKNDPKNEDFPKSEADLMNKPLKHDHTLRRA